MAQHVKGLAAARASTQNRSARNHKPTKNNDPMTETCFETLTLAFDRRGVATVALTRAEALNTFDDKTVDELMWAFALLSADSRVRVIVLAASGRPLHTCVPDSERRPCADGACLTGLMAMISDCPKPVVARLQGAVYGAALALCCVSDIVLASPDARFAVGHPRLGLAASAIVPYLHGTVGKREAQRLALTGEVIDAARAARLQLVSDVVAADTMDQAVEKLVLMLVANEPHRLDETKAVLRQLGPVPRQAEMVERRIAGPAERRRPAFA
jgi:methylglutaconyl-CoA hydratase